MLEKEKHISKAIQPGPHFEIHLVLKINDSDALMVRASEFADVMANSVGDALYHFGSQKQSVDGGIGSDTPEKSNRMRGQHRGSTK